MSGLELSSARLVPVPGPDGWLARLPGAVVWAPDDSEAADELLAACLAAGGPIELLGRVGSRLADPHAAPWPPFAILAARGPDLVAVVHGPAEVVVDCDGAETKLYGGDDIGSWLNRVLKGARWLRSGARGEDEGRANLRDGVIRANGFVLTAGAAPGPSRQASAAPASAERSPGAVRPTAGGQVCQEPPQEEAFDAPTVVDQVASRGGSAVDVRAVDVRGPRAQGSTVVRGALCPRDHLNDPRESYCGTCGLPLGAGAPEVEGPRPPLGQLTWDNGEVDQLAGATLVGRDVASEPAVMAGRLAPLVPGGQNDSMSRVHAELQPSGWDVVVLDRGSTNGTFIWHEQSKAWQRLVPGEPQVIRPGAVLAFGERTATFEPVAASAT